jgi:2-oxopent-4-enoate/cis-2-oxohex-4-enoate hydratase
LQTETINRYGDELYQALQTAAAIDPLTEREPDITIEDAYAIQGRMIARRLETPGEKVIGKKIGVTSKAVMDMLNVRQPDFGQLLTSMFLESGATCEMARMIAPRAEGEIAFVLKHDLEGPGVTLADVILATDYVSSCFEIVDSRIRDWRIKIQDTVADNGSAAALVIGRAKVDPRKIDLSLVGMTLTKNGEIVATGAGAAALGHPANAVAWLANTLGALGVPLKAGEVILSGSLAALIPVVAGDDLTMTIGEIGSASVRFA